MIALSILIPTVKRHASFLATLLLELNLQAMPYEGQIEILVDDSEIDSIGEKRNRLLARSGGKYVVFFDADDRPSPTYISSNMAGIEKGVDCCSLKGEYSVDGRFDGVFEHSLKYPEWKTTGNEVKYERCPNHLNAIKAEIAKQFKFPEKNHGEDHNWSTQIHNSRLLKTEHYINEVIYYYDKKTR